MNLLPANATGTTVFFDRHRVIVFRICGSDQNGPKEVEGWSCNQRKLSGGYIALNTYGGMNNNLFLKEGMSSPCIPYHFDHCAAN